MADGNGAPETPAVPGLIEPGKVNLLGMGAQVIDFPKGADLMLGPPGGLITEGPLRILEGAMILILDPSTAAQLRGQIKKLQGAQSGRKV